MSHSASLEPFRDRRGLLGCGLLFRQQMVEAEHHERVGVGQHAFVDREPVAGLVDALEDGDRVSGRLLGQLLEGQRGPVEELQCACDALQKTRGVVPRRAYGLEVEQRQFRRLDQVAEFTQERRGVGAVQRGHRTLATGARLCA